MYVSETIVKDQMTWHWWLIPVILETHEAEVRKIAVCSQPRQTVHETLSQNNPSKKDWWSVSRCRP
jgi:hypothetical protein